MAAARAVGREDLVVTTFDLGLSAALDLASGGMIRGIGAQRPYDAGETEALLAGYALLGKPAPAFVALPALAVSQANVLASWEQVYRRPAPEALVRAAETRVDEGAQ
jgi:ribose transport system substrate-binding protein